MTIPLKIISLQGDGYHALVDVSVFGNSYLLVLDTGASRTAFDHATFIDAGDHTLLKTSERLSTGLGTNEMVSSTVMVNDLIINDFPVADFEVAILDLSTINIAYRQLGHPDVLGVLGSDILVKYNAVIDYGKQEMVLRMN